MQYAAQETARGYGQCALVLVLGFTWRWRALPCGMWCMARGDGAHRSPYQRRETSEVGTSSPSSMQSSMHGALLVPPPYYCNLVPVGFSGPPAPPIPCRASDAGWAPPCPWQHGGVCGAVAASRAAETHSACAGVRRQRSSACTVQTRAPKVRTYTRR